MDYMKNDSHLSSLIILFGDFDTFMKTRRLVTLCALLGALVVSSGSAFADPPKLGPGSTSLGGTTIGGYVDSFDGGEFQPGRHHGWYWSFITWFGFYGR